MRSEKSSFQNVDSESRTVSLHHGKITHRSALITIPLVAVLSLGGCGGRHLTPRAENPVIEDYVDAGGWDENLVGTLAMDAGRRVTTVRIGNSPGEIGEFCAEPPPDAMVNVLSAMGADLSASVQNTLAAGATDKVEAAARIYRDLATVMNPLLRRSQGLQWNRDNMSYACHYYMNRFVTREEFVDLIKESMNKSAELVALEIEKLPKLDVTLTDQKLPPFPNRGNSNEKKPDPSNDEKKQQAAGGALSSGPERSVPARSDPPTGALTGIADLGVAWGWGG